MLLLVLNWQLSAQKKNGFSFPLDSPYVLTANYGELRPNHFHAGLDFSTGGQVNLPVYAAADGYVYRIKVSATGYGKCLYITHANGKVTVYGHLNSYSIKISDLVKKEQYAQESYEVEFFPKPFMVPIKKGEIIGLSGSTGNSTGPHLHFEIRDEKSEAPLNPLEFLSYPDRTRPMIQTVALYSLSDTLAPKPFKQIRVLQNDDDVLLPDNPLINIDNPYIGIAFAGYDRFTPAGSPNNIYIARLYFDGRLIYSHKLSGIFFDDTRYINEYSETNGGLKFQKCFLPETYPTEMIGRAVNRGRILLRDSGFHMIKLLVEDEWGNENDIQFHVRCGKPLQYTGPALKSDLFVNCRKDFVYAKNGVKLTIPANTLFYSTPLVVENTLSASGKLIIFPGDANLRVPAIVAFKLAPHQLKNKHKLVLKCGQQEYTPRLSADSACFYIKSFGGFQLTEDHQAPKIIPQFKAKRNKVPVASSMLGFIITDALSGIGKYKLYLNNKFVIAEYDAKADLLFYKFDDESPKGKINIRLEVEDRAGNRSKFEGVVRR